MEFISLLLIGVLIVYIIYASIHGLSISIFDVAKSLCNLNKKDEPGDWDDLK